MIEYKGYNQYGLRYVTCILCHKPVTEISVETEPPYRYHPDCRPHVIAYKEKQHLDRKVADDVMRIARMKRERNIIKEKRRENT